MLTRDEARAYFAACGLNYKDITLHELRYLEIELNGEFNKIYRAGREAEKAPVLGTDEPCQVFQGAVRPSGRPSDPRAYDSPGHIF